MTRRERMLAGLPCDPNDPDLAARAVVRQA